jgi:PAS domain S-box-containing protein
MSEEIDRLKALTAEQPHLQMVLGALESLSDPVVIVDPENYVIVYVNQQAEFVFGYNREDLKGQHINILIPEARKSAHSEHLEEFRNHPHARSMMGGSQLTAISKTNREIKCLVKIEPYSTDYGRYISAQVRVL